MEAWRLVCPHRRFVEIQRHQQCADQSGGTSPFGKGGLRGICGLRETQTPKISLNPPFPKREVPCEEHTSLMQFCLFEIPRAHGQMTGERDETNYSGGVCPISRYFHFNATLNLRNASASMASNHTGTTRGQKRRQRGSSGRRYLSAVNQGVTTPPCSTWAARISGAAVSDFVPRKRKSTLSGGPCPSAFRSASCKANATTERAGSSATLVKKVQGLLAK